MGRGRLGQIDQPADLWRGPKGRELVLLSLLSYGSWGEVAAASLLNSSQSQFWLCDLFQ